MNDIIREKCDLFAENRTILRKKFVFEDNLMCVVSGLIFAMEDASADPEKLAECRKILKKHAGLFSDLRSELELVVLSRMALSADPEQYLTNVQEVCRKFKEAKFRDDPYLIIAGMMICDLDLQDDCGDIVSRAKTIMERLNKSHPVITSSEDTSFVVIPAISYKDADTVIGDLEEGFDYITKTYKRGPSRDAAQDLCEVLAVTYGDMRSKCDAVMRIFEAFKACKRPFGSEHEFSALGALADTGLSPGELADEIIEASDYLKDKSGFGDESVGEKKRMMYAALLIAGACGREPGIMGNPAVAGTLSMITAKKTAAMLSVMIKLAGEAIPAVLSVLQEKGD